MSEPFLMGSDGLRKFIDHYFQAPDDADIEMRLADSPQIEGTLVVCSIVGTCTAVMTPDEADILAGICERTARKFHGWREAASLHNLILGLRQTAVQARKAAPLPSSRER